MKRFLKIVGVVLLALIVVVGGYVAYVFIDYHRLPDMDAEVETTGEPVRAGEVYTIASWNLGFGAYSDDFGFFMDGGTESRAYSEEAVRQNIGHAIEVLKGVGPDFMILQELDFDATRSHHVDEVGLVTEAMAGFESYFAQNYDSPYLFYPILKPHGAAQPAHRDGLNPVPGPGPLLQQGVDAPGERQGPGAVQPAPVGLECVSKCKSGGIMQEEYGWTPDGRRQGSGKRVYRSEWQLFGTP